jgi:hypothetical protein
LPPLQLQNAAIGDWRRSIIDRLTWSGKWPSPAQTPGKRKILLAIDVFPANIQR